MAFASYAEEIKMAITGGNRTDVARIVKEWIMADTGMQSFAAVNRAIINIVAPVYSG